MNQNNQNQEAMEHLAPSTKPLAITINGNTVHYTVKPLQTRQIWPILRLGIPLLGSLGGILGMAPAPRAEVLEGMLGVTPAPAGSPLVGKPGPAQAPAIIEQIVGPEISSLVMALAEHGEKITEILAIALDEKLTTVSSFMPQDTFLALRAVYEVNKDFFQTHMAPQLGLNVTAMEESAMAQAIRSHLHGTPGDGETQSSS